MKRRVTEKHLSVNCYFCDECFELFESHASMARSAAYGKDHRIRCPNCASESARPVVADPRGSRELCGQRETSG